MSSASEAVARQYEAYPYPAPRDDLPDDLTVTSDPKFFWPLFWPEIGPRKDAHILVAGCGTYQAVAIARHNPECDIVGIDLSDASLASTLALAKKYNVTNLDLLKLDLHKVRSLQRTFDLIISTGVLHHLEDPDAGLRALASVLNRDGAMKLMLYGASRRVGVYLLQDMFRRMGIQQTAEGVTFIRETLKQLPKHHYIHVNMPHALTTASDSEIVDLFLHPIDRAYSVPQVINFAERNGMQFHGWVENASYYPDASVDMNSTLGRRIAALPERDQWAIVENINVNVGRHDFVVCHKGVRPPRSFSRANYLGYKPVGTPGTKPIKLATDTEQGTYQRADVHFGMSAPVAAIWDRCDGRKTVAQILYDLKIKPSPAVASALETLWRTGNIL